MQFIAPSFPSPRPFVYLPEWEATRSLTGGHVWGEWLRNMESRVSAIQPSRTLPIDLGPACGQCDGCQKGPNWCEKRWMKLPLLTRIDITESMSD